MALRLPARWGQDTAIHDRIAAAVADDHRGLLLVIELDGESLLPIYVAPPAPVPALHWGDPRQVAARTFGLGLDQKILQLLTSLNRHRVWDSLRNYNRLASLEPELRARRIQALMRFPLLVAPILLTAHHRLQFEGGKRHAWRDHDDAVIEAIDFGRDLTGALARHYRISRALVRAPICATMWGNTALSHQRLLLLLDGIPPNRRPASPDDFETAMPLFITLNLLAHDQDDLGRIGRRAFSRGLAAVCAPLHRYFDPLGPALADCRDFIRAALRVARADDRDARRQRLSEQTLHLAWIETLGFRSLLAASQRWHRLVPDQPDQPLDGQRLSGIVGEFQTHDGRATELLTQAALIKEGQTMRHCIANYWPDCRDRGTRVFSLWYLGERATGDYGFDPIRQIFAPRDLRGPRNAEPGPALRGFAQAVGRELNALERAAARTKLAESLMHKGSQRDDEDAPPARLDARGEAELARVLGPLFGAILTPEVRLRAAVAGFGYGEGPTLEERMAPGDALALIREPENPRDARALALHWRGQRIGYVPRGFNVEIAQQLDQGQPLDGRIVTIDRQAPLWRRVEFELYAPIVERKDAT